MSIYKHEVTLINGDKQSLKDYEANYLVIVNTASKCGLVGQLEGLEEIYKDFKDKGVVVLGFPSNQFMGQEPLDNTEIQSFCEIHYDVTFPLFEKIDVNGEGAHPLYKELKDQTGGKKIKWNYTKFIVTPKEGQIIRFAPTTSPKKVRKELESLINSN